MITGAHAILFSRDAEADRAFLADLADRGVELAHPVTDEGWGRLASFRLPSGAEQFVYEPRHPLAHGGT